MLAHRYIRRVDVLNRGFSGYNSRWALELLKKMKLPKQNIIFATIFLGANDAQERFEEMSLEQHIDLEEYKENLGKVIQYLTEELGIKRVVLITPPPLDEVAWLHELKTRNKTGKSEAEVNFLMNLKESDRKNKTVASYAEGCRAVCTEFKARQGVTLACVDLWPRLSTAPTDGLYSDGLHFGTTGNRLVFEAVVESIKTNFPELALHLNSETNELEGDLPMFAPHWSVLATKTSRKTAPLQ